MTKKDGDKNSGKNSDDNSKTCQSRLDPLRTSPKGREGDEYLHELQRQGKRSRTRRFLARIIAYPLLFVLVNGLFILLVWSVGLLQVIFSDRHQVIFYLRLVPFSILYIGYLFLCNKLGMKLLKKLGMTWLFGDD